MIFLNLLFRKRFSGLCVISNLAVSEIKKNPSIPLQVKFLVKLVFNEVESNWNLICMFTMIVCFLIIMPNESFDQNCKVHWTQKMILRVDYPCTMDTFLFERHYLQDQQLIPREEGIKHPQYRTSKQDLFNVSGRKLMRKCMHKHKIANFSLSGS